MAYTGINCGKVWRRKPNYRAVNAGIVGCNCINMVPSQHSDLNPTLTFVSWALGLRNITMVLVPEINWNDGDG